MSPKKHYYNALGYTLIFHVKIHGIDFLVNIRQRKKADAVFADIALPGSGIGVPVAIGSRVETVL